MVGQLAYELVEMGTFLHSCEGEIVCESVNTKIPYFNAPIYLENKVRLVRETQTSDLGTDKLRRPQLAKSTRS